MFNLQEAYASGLGQKDAAPLSVAGPVGNMEVFLDAPLMAPCGLAIVAHPQPLLGGTAKHKIPQLLARALRDAGWLVLRPNFRGVGASAGLHDHGVGETEDILALIRALDTWSARLPLSLLGFSFGAFVQAGVARRLEDDGMPPVKVVLAGIPSGEVEGQRRYDTPTVPRRALVVHGECDERVPLSAVLSWARPSAHPVVVVPGRDHFFTGHLPVLRTLVMDYMTQR